jgi:hypothetical protein
LADLGVQRHLRALIPGQRTAQLGRQHAQRGDDRVTDGLRAVVDGQVQQDGEPRGALHQRPDRRLVARTGDQSGSPDASLLRNSL